MKSPLALLTILLALLVVSQSTSNFLYSFPHQATDWYYLPAYPLQTLTLGYTLSIKINIPNFAVGFGTINDIDIQILNGIDKVTPEAPPTKSASCLDNDCTWTW